MHLTERGDMNDSVSCVAELEHNPDGGFTVSIVNLPGVVSEGDTEREALENIKEALRAAIRTYRNDKVEVPWISGDEPSVLDSRFRLIVVNV